MKPSAAASRVAAARAAAKATKPPPTRKTSEGKASPARKASASTSKDISEKDKNELQLHVGKENVVPDDAVLDNGAGAVLPAAVKAGDNHETEVGTVDATIADIVCQNVEKTVVGEGEVSVGGEGGDIGTSEC